MWNGLRIRRLFLALLDTAAVVLIDGEDREEETNPLQRFGADR